jgi:paraquat-inducible protein B
MNNEQTKKAIVEKRKKSSITWLIPLVALLATSWLIYKSISEAGVDIVVNFKSGNGFKAGKTMVFYKGYNLGKVSKVTVGSDLQSVNAHITISKEAANFITREGTDFWIVKPRFSVSEISGLDTLISGVYIEVRPSSIDMEKIKKLKEKFQFDGHDEKPLKYHREDGLNITLKAKNLSGISVGTPIFYKKFKIGEVIATKLFKNNVKIFINLQKEYTNLVNSSTVFWNVSGVKVDAGLGGVNVQMDSLTSLISGGIAFSTLDVNADKINSKDEFFLHKDYKEIEQSKSIIKLTFDNAKGLKEGKTPILYKGIEIGKIKTVELIDNKIVATAFLDKKYKEFNTSNTKYYKVDLSIDGIKVKNLETILSGIYIAVIPSEGDFSDEFKVYNTKAEALKEDLLNITMKSEKLYNLNIGSKIYYKNIFIGAVTSYKFTEDLEHVIIQTGIIKKYSHLVNSKTNFTVSIKNGHIFFQ